MRGANMLYHEYNSVQVLSRLKHALYFTYDPLQNIKFLKTNSPSCFIISHIFPEAI